MSGDSERFPSAGIRYARHVPKWQATLNALQELSDIGPDAPVGYGGGISPRRGGSPSRFISCFRGTVSTPTAIPL